MLPVTKVVVRLLVEGTVQEGLQAAGRLTGMNILRGEQVTRYCDERRDCGVISRSVVVPVLADFTPQSKLHSVSLTQF